MQKKLVIVKFLWLCAVVNLTVTPAVLFAQPIDQTKVNQIKAAYIFHMAQLTTWPGDELDELESLRVVFIGEETHKLADILADRTKSILVQGHHLEVQRVPLTAAEDDQIAHLKTVVRNAHIIYVSEDAAASTLEACRRYANNSLLMAGDGEMLPSEGGMVGFYIDAQRVRINVNLSLVEQSTLKMSAEFLQHVTIVDSNAGSR